MNNPNLYPIYMSLIDAAEIKSTVEQPITSEISIKLGQCIGMLYKDVTIGMDANPSNEVLGHALISGLLSVGARVRYAGCAPLSAIALTSFRSDCYIMISEPNTFGVSSGFTLGNPDGSEFNEDQLRALRIEYNNPNPNLPEYKNVESILPIDGVVEKYRRRIVSGAGETDCPVAIDCGCGVASLVVPQIFTDIHADISTLNCQIDGRCPARSPSVEENDLTSLIEFVESNPGHIGIAFNGDGTRITVIDELGNMVTNTELLALLAYYINPESIVVPMNTSALLEEIYKGKVYKSCDSKICDLMKETDTKIGARANGTYVFSQLSFCSDGLCPAIAIAKLAANESIQNLIQGFPKYIVEQTKVVYEGNENREIFRRKMLETLEDLEHVNLIESTGWRFEMEDGWFLIWYKDGDSFIDIVAEGKDKAYVVGLIEIAKNAISTAMRN